MTAYSPVVNIRNISTPDVVDMLNLPVTFIAQKLSGGTATAGTLIEDVSLTNVDTLFGAGSQASAMVKQFRKINTSNKVNVFAMADPSSGNAKASGTQTLTGTASSAGKYKISIDGKDYEASFVSSATPTSIFDSIRTAISSDADAIITASGTSTLVLTHKHDGVFGNNTSVKVEIFNTSGILDNCGLTPASVAFTSGTGLPSLSTFASETANIQSIYVCDYNIVKDNTLGIALIDTLASRVDALNKLTFSGLCFCVTDNDTDFSTLINGNPKYKKLFLYPVYSNRVSTSYIKGDYNNNATYNVSSAFVATITAFVNNKADTSKIKIGTLFGDKSNFGCNLSGLIIPTLNYNTSIKNELSDTFHALWSNLGVTTIVTNGLQMTIGNEGYTTSTSTVDKFLSTALMQYAIQQEFFNMLKGAMFQNNKSTSTLNLDIKSSAKFLISKLSNETMGYQWLNKDEMSTMEKSIVVTNNPADRSKSILTYTLSLLIPFTGIDAQITFQI